jgi:hypothetical protein
MRIACALAASLVLMGCEKSADKAPAPEIGRWVVVQAPTVPDAPLAGRAAWRIDTITGALEFCEHTPGNLTCTDPVPVPVKSR